MAKRGNKTKGEPEGDQDGEEKRSNQLDGDQLQEYFDALHEANDKLDANNAKARGDMNKIYEKAANATDLPVGVLKHLYALDRAERRKRDKEKRKFEVADRDAFRAIADAFGEDTPIGVFAREAAERAGEDRE